MTTTLQATPTLLEGYVGPCSSRPIHSDDWQWDIVDGSDVGVLTFPYEDRAASADRIRLDLSPLPSGIPSPAYWHVGALVCRKVGLDPSGGFVLAIAEEGIEEIVSWALSDGSRNVCFYDHTVGSPDGFDAYEVVLGISSHDRRDAYPEALCAIARALEL
jgi:hypothetical protein